MIGRVQGYQICIKDTGESDKLFGDKILSKNSPYQPTNFSYFLSEAIMYRHEIDIEDLSQGGRRGLI